MLYIRELIWDNLNIAHISRHGIVPEEVEQVCHSQPVVWQPKAKKGRVFVIGPKATGQMLVVILDAEPDSGVYYVVTAHPANRAERRIYEQQKGGEQTS